MMPMLVFLDFRRIVSKVSRLLGLVAAHFLLLASIVSGQAGVKLSGIIYYNGEPMGGFPVSLFTPNDVLTTTADKTGRFEFSYLPPGTYDLQAKYWGVEGTIYGIRIEGKDIGPLTVELRIVENLYPLDIDCGRTIWLSYEPKEASGGRVKGTLDLEPDVALPSGLLTNVKIDLAGVTAPHRRVSQRVDDHGNFEFQNLPPGRYRLRAHARGYRGTQSIIWIARKDTTKVKILLYKRGHQAVCL